MESPESDVCVSTERIIPAIHICRKYTPSLPVMHSSVSSKDFLHPGPDMKKKVTNRDEGGDSSDRSLEIFLTMCRRLEVHPNYLYLQWSLGCPSGKYVR